MTILTALAFCAGVATYWLARPYSLAFAAALAALASAAIIVIGA